jgi:hypothetical protein
MAAPADSQPPSAGPFRGRNRLIWAAIGLGLVVQLVLFREFARREVVWAYPPYHDQACYLLTSYTIFEQMLDKGLAAGLKFGWDLRLPQGVLLHQEAALLYLLLGAGRLSALTLNFLHFALLQLALVGTLRWLTGRWSVALLGLGLLLSAGCPFILAGGIADFRIDCVAWCLFGVLLCTVVRSNMFASRRWSLAVGAAAAWLGLFRLVALGHMTAMALLLLPVLAARLAWRWRDPEGRRAELRRWAGAGIAAAVVAVVCGPVLWALREPIKNYYVVGHVTGEERAVRLEMFLRGGGNLYTYYPKTLFGSLTGPTFLRLGGLALLAAVAAAGAAWWRRRTRGEMPAGAPRVSVGLLAAVVAVGFLAPLAILTADVHRGECVATFLFPPFLWLALLAVVGLAGLHRTGRGRPAVETGWAVLAALALVAGGWAQVSRYSERSWISRARPEMERVAEMYDLLGRFAAQHGLKSPVISSNMLHEAFNWIVPATYIYERSGVLLDTKPALLSLLARDEAGAMHDLEISDFVLLGRPFPEVGPFEASMERLMPQLSAYCERELRCVWHWDVFGRDLRLYVRPQLRSEGGSGPWVTPDGLTLKGSGWALRDCKRVELRGKTPFCVLPNGLTPLATLAVGGRRPRPLKAEMTHQGDYYCITLEMPRAPLPEQDEVTVRLTFDKYWEPKDHGWPNDHRRLVILKPESTRLVR